MCTLVSQQHATGTLDKREREESNMHRGCELTHSLLQMNKIPVNTGLINDSTARVNKHTHAHIHTLANDVNSEYPHAG